jgi:hypothetical protein
MKKRILSIYISIIYAYTFYGYISADFGIAQILVMLICAIAVFVSINYVYGLQHKYQINALILLVSLSMVGILFPNFQYAFHSLISFYFTLGFANDNLAIAYALSTGGVDVRINFGGPKYEGYYIAIDVIPAIVLMLYYLLPSNENPKDETLINNLD